jgi:hypothetical protein
VACDGLLWAFGKRNDEARDAVIQADGSAVEHIAEQLTVQSMPICKDANRETFTRLNSVEQRVSKLEVQPRI